MVGELDVAIADRKMTIEFLSDHILVRFPDYQTTRSMMRQPLPNLKLVGKLLSFSEIGLRAKIGQRKAIELFPQPSWIVRLLSPSLRELLDVANGKR